MRRYLSLTVFMCGVSLRRLIEYRADFLLGAVGFVIQLGLQALLIGVVFSLVPSIGGWNVHQVLFLLGFSLLPRGLDKLFTDNLWVLGTFFIRSGEFYRCLIRPVSPFFMLVSERFIWPDALGELVVGAALVGYATSGLDLGVSPAVAVAVTPLLAVCGALIFMSVKLLFASVAFWTTDSFAAMHSANQLAEFTAYPLGIYPRPFQSLLTWGLPFAFTSYVPARYLLFGDTSLVWWTPLVAGTACCIAIAVWRRGLARYEMTGS